MQARTGSTRLPGKVLADLAGRPMLAHQLRRLQACRLADDIVVATTEAAADDPLTRLADEAGVRWFRGSEDDVLARYLGAAREAGADVVVRVTADCPLIDPEQTDRVTAALGDGLCDYASNVVRRTFPRGLDSEAMTREALERAGRLAVSAAAREHVTRVMLVERPELFRLRSVEDERDNSDLRWTVDTAADLEMVRRVYAALSLDARILPYPEVLAFVRAHPEVSALNAAVRQKAG